MNREEFNKTRWGANMKCSIHGKGGFDIVTVSFPEALVGVVEDKHNYHDADEISWYRCESIDLI